MYSGGQGPIWLDNVVCTGTEETIFDCTHSRVGIHDCTHIEDVAIQCMPGMYRVGGRGQGPVWLDDVVCSGSDKTIHDCTHRPIGIHDCTHIEDIATYTVYARYVK